MNELSWLMNIIFLYLSFLSLSLMMNFFKLNFSFLFKKNHNIYYYSILI